MPSLVATASNVCQTVQNTVGHVTGKINKSLETPSGLQKVVKLVMNVAVLFFGVNSFVGMRTSFGHVDSMVDAIGTPGDIHRIYTGEYGKEALQKRDYSMLGNLFLAAADVCGTLLILTEFNIVDLSAAALRLGNMHVFGVAPFAVMSLGTLAGAAATLGFVFLAADALQLIDERSCGKEERPSQVQTYKNLAYALSEVALKTLLAFGITNRVGIALAGISAAYCGIEASTHEDPVAQRGLNNPAVASAAAAQ